MIGKNKHSATMRKQFFNIVTRIYLLGVIPQPLAHMAKQVKQSEPTKEHVV